MAKLRIDEDGDLEIIDSGDFVYVKPRQFAELRDLLDKALTPAAEPPRWYINKSNALCFGDLSIFYHSSGTSETTDMSDYAEPRSFGDMADWLVEHQPAATLEQVKEWGRLDEAAEPVHAFIQQQITKSTQKPARWSYNNDRDALRYDDTYAMGAEASGYDDAQDLIDWVVANQPVLNDKTEHVVIHAGSDMVYEALKPIMDAAQAASTPAKPAIWQIVDTRLNCVGYGTAYDWSFMAEPTRQRAMEMAYWFQAHQPTPTAEELDSVRSAGHVDCYKLLRKRCTATDAAPAAPSWFINSEGSLDYHPSLGDDYVMAHAMADMPLLQAQELSDWFIKHQPAISDVDRKMLTGVGMEAKNSAASARLLQTIRANIEAAQHSYAAAQYDATCEAVADAEHPYWRIGNDIEDGMYLAIRNPMPSDHDEPWPVMFWIKDVEPADRARAREVAAWLVEHQPEATADLVRLSYDEDSHACAIAMSVHVDNLQIAADRAEPLPFTPDRAEVSDDPRFWQQVAEKAHIIIEDVINDGSTSQPRTLRVYFTFDPSDISVASRVYAALGQLPLDIKAAVEIR